MRGLYYLANYLERSGSSTFEQTFQEAADFFRTKVDDDPVCAFFSESVTRLGNYDFHNFGLVAHMTLHENRAEFDRLLREFVQQRPLWDEPAVRVAFELDLVMRPYIYAEPFRFPAYAFEHLDLHPFETLGVEVRLSPLVSELLTSSPDLVDLEQADSARIVHSPTRKLPHMSRRSVAHNASYCQGMILRMRELLPSIESAVRAASVGLALTSTPGQQ